jgi:hypothetical protein
VYIKAVFSFLLIFVWYVLSSIRRRKAKNPYNMSVSFFTLDFFFFIDECEYDHSILRCLHKTPSLQNLPYQKKGEREREKKTCMICCRQKVVFFILCNVYCNKYVLKWRILVWNERIEVYCVCSEKIYDNKSLLSMFVEGSELQIFFLLLNDT